MTAVWNHHLEESRMEEQGETMKEYLPLGSIVILEGFVHKIMIAARGVTVDMNGKKCYYDYGACRYPEGMSDGELMYFNREAVDEVISRGYTDNSEGRIMEAMEKAEAGKA